MSQATPVAPPSHVRRLWRKWRFHLNILLLLIPLGFMPKYFADVAMFRGESGLGEREIGEIQVGPWSLHLAELNKQAPMFSGPAGYMKAFNAALCSACTHEVKATYLRIGKPRSLRTAGAIFFGTPYRASTNVPMPRHASADDALWITMEGWDGSMHQASIPLSQASPATAAWLAQQGGKP